MTETEKLILEEIRLMRADSARWEQEMIERPPIPTYALQDEMSNVIYALLIGVCGEKIRTSQDTVDRALAVLAKVAPAKHKQLAGLRV